MAHNCENCKFYDAGYEWNDESEDEVEIEVCQKGHRFLLHLPFKCPYFKEYEPEPYVEQFTECDKCEYLTECKKEGRLIDCTRWMDNFEHFTSGVNAYCRRRIEPFKDKKLSEMIKMLEKNDPKLRSGKEFLQKAIELFGDITYKEFDEDKKYKM